MPDIDLTSYKEIRGRLFKKKKSLLGVCSFCIDDGKDRVWVNVGKAIYRVYAVGDELTVGYIDRKVIYLRTGIIDNDD